MRIIAGSRKGRRIATRKGRDVRPTLDRVRESLFSIIGPNIDATRVLDLFTGSGALGLEALSRGAASCCFVDHNLESIRTVQQNVTAFGFDDQSTILKLELPKDLQKLADRALQFDLVLADPPYDFRGYPELVSQLCRCKLLAGGGQVILEHWSRVELDDTYGPLTRVKHKIYGESALSVYA